MTSNHKPEAGLKELKDFIETAKLDASSLADANADTKGLYRKFYALLVFDYLLQSTLVDSDQKTFAREAISDFSHGFFLTCIGLYKPARTCARSGIENLIRFLLLEKEEDVLKIKDVHSLFDEANKIFPSGSKQKARVGKLRTHYRELCKSVHSTSADYMNLEVPFKTMLAFDQNKFASNRDIVRECCKTAGELLFIRFNELVQSAHHSHKDILSDSVARSVRKEARLMKETL